jgi:RNA polymerase-binding transcription factor DksA
MKTPASKIPRQWQWHYRALTALRAELLQEHEIRDRAWRELSEEVVADPVDRASDAQERDELLTELAVEEAELSDIDAALERLRAGTYGLCAATGQPIDPDRLRAVPWTRFSRAVAARLEQRN